MSEGVAHQEGSICPAVSGCTGGNEPQQEPLELHLRTLPTQIASKERVKFQGEVQEKVTRDKQLEIKIMRVPLLQPVFQRANQHVSTAGASHEKH